MLLQIISWVAVFALFASSLALLLVLDWRWNIGLLALLYLGVFWLVQTHWSISMAAIKLVTGWMVATILGMTRATREASLGAAAEQSWHSGRFFRFLAAFLSYTVALAATPQIIKLLPGIGLPEVSGSLILMTIGLLMLGLTTQPLRVTIGLLTFMAGFEILYAAVESATLVAALLAVVNLGLAFIGAYLLTADEENTTERQTP